MGRPKGKDRGLVLRKTKDGVRFWRVRLWHHGRDVTFQPFWAKSDAQRFYVWCKAMQAKDQFVPQLYQHPKGRKKSL